MTFPRSMMVAVALGVACAPDVTGSDGAESGDGTDAGDATTGMVDDATGSGSGTTTMPETSTMPSTTDPDTTVGNSSSDDTATAGSSSETGPGGLCEPGPASDCVVGVDCTRVDCGGLGSWFDENGCVRAPCSLKGNCPDDGICFSPQQWGMCATSGLDCTQNDETCSCTADDDCGGEICMPAGEAPPTQCGELSSLDACTDAGCGPFIDGRPITAANGGVCLCDLAEPHCIWLQPDTMTSVGAATAYLNLVDGTVIVFEDRFEPPPLGYAACDTLLVSTPECDCAQVLPCAM